jgi:hypothetical protein
MDKSALIASVIGVAKAVTPLIHSTTPATLTAGLAVLKLVDTLKATAGAAPDQIAEFDASREALEKAVAAHAGCTAASLG